MNTIVQIEWKRNMTHSPGRMKRKEAFINSLSNSDVTFPNTKHSNHGTQVHTIQSKEMHEMKINGMNFSWNSSENSTFIQNIDQQESNNITVGEIHGKSGYDDLNHHYYSPSRNSAPNNSNVQRNNSHVSHDNLNTLTTKDVQSKLQAPTEKTSIVTKNQNVNTNSRKRRVMTRQNGLPSSQSSPLSKSPSTNQPHSQSTSRMPLSRSTTPKSPLSRPTTPRSPLSRPSTPNHTRPSQDMKSSSPLSRSIYNSQNNNHNYNSLQNEFASSYISESQDDIVMYEDVYIQEEADLKNSRLANEIEYYHINARINDALLNNELKYRMNNGMNGAGSTQFEINIQRERDNFGQMGLTSPYSTPSLSPKPLHEEEPYFSRHLDKITNNYTIQGKNSSPVHTLHYIYPKSLSNDDTQNLTGYQAVEHFIRSLPPKTLTPTPGTKVDLKPKDVLEMNEIERLDTLVATLKRKAWIENQMREVNEATHNLERKSSVIGSILNTTTNNQNDPHNSNNHDSSLYDGNFLPSRTKSDHKPQKEENSDDDLTISPIRNLASPDRSMHGSEERMMMHRNNNLNHNNLMEQSMQFEKEIQTKNYFCSKCADVSAKLLMKRGELASPILQDKSIQFEEIEEITQKSHNEFLNEELASPRNEPITLEVSTLRDPATPRGYSPRENVHQCISDPNVEASIQDLIMHLWKAHEYENLLNVSLDARMDTSLNHVRIDSQIYEDFQKKYPQTTIHQFHEIFRSMQVKLCYFLDLNLTVEEINTLLERQECIPSASIKPLWNSIKSTNEYKQFKQRQLLSKYYKYRAELWGAGKKQSHLNHVNHESLRRSSLTSRILPNSAFSPPGTVLNSPRSSLPMNTPRLKSKTIKLSQFTNIDQLRGHTVYFHSIMSNTREDYIIDAVGEIHPYGRKFFLSEETMEQIRSRFRILPKVIRGIVTNCSPAKGGFRFGVKKTSKFAIIDLELD